MRFREEDTNKRLLGLQSIPGSLKKIFEDCPLMIGEDAQKYDLIVSDILADIQPSGAIEFIWCKEIADYIWDLHRLRRMRKHAIEEEYAAALIDIADFDYIRKEDQTDGDIDEMIYCIVQGARENNPPDVAELNAVLVKAGLTHESVILEVRGRISGKISMIDREIVRYENRRDELLHQIAGWGALRRARAREALDRAARAIEAKPLDAVESNLVQANTILEAPEQPGTGARNGSDGSAATEKGRVEPRRGKTSARKDTS